MKSEVYQEKIGALLRTADIEINGTSPWDIQVHNEQLYGRILGYGSLGLGESYMDGWWDCAELDTFFCKLLNAELAAEVTTLRDKLFYLWAHLVNRQAGKRAWQVGQQHYDVGNDLYQRMLDPRMIYSCGYWQDAADLAEAQTHKLEMVCRKLKLQPGMRVLDIGCGWGGAARYMAANYEVEVTGITVSEEQFRMAQQQSAATGTNFQLLDYRDLQQRFDRIFSIGMFEHVGFKNYRTFFRTVHRCLEDGGLFLLHTIGHRVTSDKVDPWIERYIFANSILPSAELINRHSADLFAVEDWHNFGLDYHRTLHAWDQNSQAAWPELPDYDKKFQRMWHYYLMCCAGAFKSYRNHLWQIVMSKGPQQSPYRAVRSGA